MARSSLVLGLSLILALALSGSASADTSFGDVNCNGAIDSVDAALVLQLEAGLINELPCGGKADVDEDGEVGALDAQYILQYSGRLVLILPPPSVVLASTPTRCPARDWPSDGLILATELLTPKYDDEFYIDRQQRDTLAADIDELLDSIRADYAAVAGIHAFPSFVYGEVIVTPGDDLSQIIRGMLREEPETLTFVTGSQEFDYLNTRLGLKGLRALLLHHSDLPLWLSLCFDDNLSVRYASDAFAGLQEVDAAQPSFWCCDGPDVEALSRGQTWYVVFRDASGDCLAGCLSEEFFYFTVTDGAIDEVDEDDALADDMFNVVLDLMLSRGGLN